MKNHISDNIRSLLIAAQSGDQKAYRNLLEVLYPYVGSIVKRKVFDTNEVLDIQQDIILSIHRSLNTYDPDREPFPWINAITHRRIIDYIRKITRKNENEGHFKDGEVTIPTFDSNIKTEDIEWLQEVNEETRHAILLTKVQGHSTAEAANMLGIKENALRTRVSRGIRKLKNYLKAEYDERT